MDGDTSSTLLAEVEHGGKQPSATGAVESPPTRSLQEHVSAVNSSGLVYEVVWNARMDASLLTLLP